MTWTRNLLKSSWSVSKVYIPGVPKKRFQSNGQWPIAIVGGPLSQELRYSNFCSAWYLFSLIMVIWILSGTYFGHHVQFFLSWRISPFLLFEGSLHFKEKSCMRIRAALKKFRKSRQRYCRHSSSFVTLSFDYTFKPRLHPSYSVETFEKVEKNLLRIFYRLCQPLGRGGRNSFLKMKTREKWKWEWK